ncbi:MAG: signal recognition particle receptor subunit alpha, partial [Candidatus Micrarchaeota archaeon]
MDLGQGIRQALAKITGATVVDEKAVKELVRELQRALLASDVNVKLVFTLSKSIEKRCLQEKPSHGLGLREHAITVVYEELSRMLGESYSPKITPHRIMLLGIYGSGKTTTAGKIARFYKSKGLKAGLIAADVHRPAAHEQLEQLSQQVGAEFYGKKGATAEEITRQGAAELAQCDVLVLDTAGRSAFDEELASELRTLRE